MLLTYSDNAQIPLKLSLFYNQAYESLFQRHDALKGGFQRQRRTNLDIQDFATVFSAFCLQSYDKREFSFSKTKALEYLDKAKAISRLQYGSEEFLSDAVQGVCLLIEEGLESAFAHRSFQEYFVAKFVQASKPLVKRKLIERYRPGSQQELVMELLYEMDPDAVEEYFLIPAIDKLRHRLGVKDKVGATHFLRFVKIMYDEFAVFPDRGAAGEGLSARIKESDVFSMVGFVRGKVEVCNAESRQREPGALELAESLRETYGTDEVRTSRLRATDHFVRDLIGSGYFHIGFLPALLRYGEVVKNRQQVAATSLESVFDEERAQVRFGFAAGSPRRRLRTPTRG